MCDHGAMSWPLAGETKPRHEVAVASPQCHSGGREVLQTQLGNQRETLRASGLVLDGKQSEISLVKSFSHSVTAPCTPADLGVCENKLIKIEGTPSLSPSV